MAIVADADAKGAVMFPLDVIVECLEDHNRALFRAGSFERHTTNRKLVARALSRLVGRGLVRTFREMGKDEFGLRARRRLWVTLADAVLPNGEPVKMWLLARAAAERERTEQERAENTKRMEERVALMLKDLAAAKPAQRAEAPDAAGRVGGRLLNLAESCHQQDFGPVSRIGRAGALP